MKKLEIRKYKSIGIKVFITLFFIALYRTGYHLSLPGLEKEVIKSAQSSSGNLNILAMLTGGNYGEFSLFSLGVTPFITASMLVQLLRTGLSVKFKKLADKGRKGRMITQRVQNALMLVFSVLMSFGLISVLKIVMKKGLPSLFTVYLWLTVGAFLLAFICDRITEWGIGNGVNVILATSILGSLNSSQFGDLLRMLEAHKTQGLAIGFVVVLLFSFSLVICMEFGEIRLPLLNSLKGKVITKASYLPIRVNSAGVLATMFVSSTYSLLNLFPRSSDMKGIKAFLFSLLDTTRFRGMAIYVLFILLFVFLYSVTQVDPAKIQESFSRDKNYIENIPTLKTERFVIRIINHLNCLAAPYMAVVVMAPMLLSKYLGYQGFLLGTSLIILIGFVRDVFYQVRSI